MLFRVTPEAILRHMAEHNRSHLKELEDIAADLTGEAKEQVMAAAELYRQGNEKLDEVLKTIKENA